MSTINRGETQIQVRRSTCRCSSLVLVLGSAAVGCTAETMVAVFWTHSFLLNRELFLLQTVVLLTLHMFTWLMTAAMFCSALQWTRCLCKSGRQATLAQFGVAGLLAVAAWFYLFAWVFHVRTGVFPNRDTLHFALVNSCQLAQYFWEYEPRNASLLVLGFIGQAVAAVFIVRAGTRLANRGCLRENSVFAALMLGLLWMNALWVGSLFAAHDLQGSATVANESLISHRWPKASFEFRFHVNPLVTLAGDLFVVESNAPEGDIPASALAPRLLQSNRPFEESRPFRSVVLITVESLRADVIGLRHQEMDVMPCVNELTRSGVFFPRCYSQSTHSDYSDPAILSSLYPLRSQFAYVYQSDSPWPVVRIYDLLRPVGYATAIFSSQNEAWSNMDQFYKSPHLDVLFDSRVAGAKTYSFGEEREWTELTGLAGKLDDAATTDAALAWIRSQQTLNRPFFLSLNFQTSHFPYRRPDGHIGPFVPAGVPGESSPLVHDSASSERIRNAYYNALHYIDAQVRRITEACSRGESPKPLFVITGDHGEAFGENGVSGHGGLPLDMTTRVGLVVWCPEIIPSRIDEYLAQSVDIGPTILGAINFAPCPAFQGVDLLSTARPKPSARLAFIHCKTAIAGTDCVMTGGGWRYSYDRLREIQQLCYRPSDKGPEADLSAEFPSVATALQAILNEWRRRQLLYYANQRYYGMYHPPRVPELDDATSSLLKLHPEPAR